MERLTPRKREPLVHSRLWSLMEIRQRNGAVHGRGPPVTNYPPWAREKGGAA